jgi:hypothetical protein
VGLSSITHRHLLLCEGAHDWQFFSQLVQTRGLPSFQITSCGNVAGAKHGRDGIDYLTAALDALPALPHFPQLEAILIVADNDGNPQGAFKKVQDLIAAAAEISPGQRYAVPPTELARNGARPVMVVMMLPWTNVNGALDSLLYISAANKRPAVARCVDAFAKCTKSDVWPMTKLAKMKLRSLMSAAHHADPYLAPAWVWSEGTDLVPINDPVFNQIEAFLRNFPALVA